MNLSLNGNGKWQKWFLGIAATVIGSLIINGIIFQRDARKDMAENRVRIDNIERRINEQNERISRIVQVIDSIYSTQQIGVEATHEFERQQKRVETRFDQLQRRVEELEKQRK